jgi:hypothetical protein
MLPKREKGKIVGWVQGTLEEQAILGCLQGQRTDGRKVHWNECPRLRGSWFTRERETRWSPRRAPLYSLNQVEYEKIKARELWKRRHQGCARFPC